MRQSSENKNLGNFLTLIFDGAIAGVSLWMSESWQVRFRYVAMLVRTSPWSAWMQKSNLCTLLAYIQTRDLKFLFFVFSGNYTNLTKTLASRYQLTSFACSDLESNTDHYSAYGVTQNGISMAVGDFIHHDTTAGGCPQFYEIVNGNINPASLLVKCDNSDFSFTRFGIQGCPAIFVRFLGLAHPLQSHNFLSSYYLQLCILCLVKGPLYPLTSSSFRLSILPCIQT